MASSGVPAVPWTSSVESPLTAAARCSETQVLAVPGTPSRSSARSVARVVTATSTIRRGPTYFGVITVPSGRVPPRRYVATAHGDSRQRTGRGRSSAARSALSSAAKASSACGRSGSPSAAPASAPLPSLRGGTRPPRLSGLSGLSGLPMALERFPLSGLSVLRMSGTVTVTAPPQLVSRAVSGRTNNTAPPH